MTIKLRMKSVVTLDDVQDDVEQVSTKVDPRLDLQSRPIVSVLREHRQQGDDAEGSTKGGSRRCSADDGGCRGEEEAGAHGRGGGGGGGQGGGRGRRRK